MDDDNRIEIRMGDLTESWASWEPTTRTIMVGHDSTPAEMRSALARGLIHCLRGDGRCNYCVVDMHKECSARRLAARLLIPIPKLLDALQYSRTDVALAESLHVDVATLWAMRESLRRDDLWRLLAFVEGVTSS